MYTEYFGLHEKPFDLLPNPDFLYPSRAHKRAQTYLTHGIKERAGFILLTGEVGSGKTTIIRNIIRSQLKNCVLAKVFNTKVDSLQLLEQINMDFDLPVQGQDKTTLLRELSDFLIEQYAKRRQCVLIIDEAQNLGPEILEEVRMLSNLETDRDKLLQIILVGQPELRDILSRAELLQLRQRIQISCHIQPLTAQEVGDYILYRLEKAGNRSALTLSADAVDAIASYTRGIPRLINVLCDYIMIDAYAAQNRDVTGQIVHELASDLDFEKQYWDSTTEPVSSAAANTLGESKTSDLAQIPATTVLTEIGLLKMRLKTLESMPVDHSDLLDLRSRMDTLEDGLQSRVKELRALIQQLRLETTFQNRVVQEEVQEKKERSGFWKFFWGD